MYYSGQSESYPDEYTSLQPPPDSGSQPQQPWEQQESHHSPVPDNVSQQPLEQGLEHPQQYRELLSMPRPPPQESPYQHQHQQLENPQRLVPSQVPPRGSHDSAPVLLVPVAGQAVRSPPVDIEPIVVRSTAAAGPSTHASTHAYHPYTRPPSASGSTSRREKEGHQQARLSSQASMPRGYPDSITHSPVTSEYGQFPHQRPSPSYISPLATPLDGALTPSFAPQQQQRRAQAPPPPPQTPRYTIRTDTQYDPTTRVLTALLELPGMKRRDLRITLATTQFNRVRQVTVSGTSRAPTFPLTSSSTSIVAARTLGPVLRERKYGSFTRAFAVPAETKPDDIDAVMEDGILILKIQCGLPAASADEREIPIR
ncbi:hypothetical protein C8F04DRAFT_1266337 [Mycena alexandri]|uniref:SHSP domain-containing protein n=1 Tax=Mycena alexandri TaxID=1745969 RepID=A0AAD6WXC4_9AGAR|nr:hypothetical protein C8F04DRAFT_1266337 [Mycena alexandri]